MSQGPPGSAGVPPAYVTDHQGSIRVEDNAPQGTVFTVELPMG